MIRLFLITFALFWHFMADKVVYIRNYLNWRKSFGIILSLDCKFDYNVRYPSIGQMISLNVDLLRTIPKSFCDMFVSRKAENYNNAHTQAQRAPSIYLLCLLTVLNILQKCTLGFIDLILHYEFLKICSDDKHMVEHVRKLKI